MSIFKRLAPTTATQAPLFPQLPLFSQLNDEISRFFERDYPLSGERLSSLEGQWFPSVDIEQQDGKYLLKADIPGVDPKDIKISIENGQLTIEGKRESKLEENKDNYRRVERSSGSFYRSFSLPDANEDKDIQAHCSNGVLEITIPRTESAKKKKIEVIVD